MFHISKKFIQFLFSLHAPDRKHIIILRCMSVSSRGVGDQSAGQGFHGNKSHICLLTSLYKLLLFLRCQITERKLQRFIQTAFDGLLCHQKAMVGDTDMADLSFLLRLQCRIIKTTVITRFWTKSGIVELININIIRLQIFKALFQILTHCFSGLRSGFCGNIKFLPDAALKSETKLVFTVTVRSRCVKETDSSVIGLAKQIDSRIITDPLNGKGSKTVFVHHNFCFSQSNLYLIHICFPSEIISFTVIFL